MLIFVLFFVFKGAASFLLHFTFLIHMNKQIGAAATKTGELDSAYNKDKKEKEIADSS